MKFDTRTKLKDQEGKEKIVSKFLFFPKSFKNDGEGFWLERKNIVYRVEKVDVGDEFFSIWKWKWIPVRFASDKDIETLGLECDDKLVDKMIDAFFKYGKKWQTWVTFDLLIVLWFSFTRSSDIIAAFILIKLWQSAFFLLTEHEERKCDVT